MSDVCKCEGGECPLKEKCYRYTCKQGEYQVYFTEVPYEEGKECDYYWNVDRKG